MDKKLRAFLAVARDKSITAAASSINLAQSSVTKRISSLEVELGAPLFHRDRRGMSLTEAGEKFLARAERIEREYRNGLEEIGVIASAGMSELTVGAGPIFHFNWVAGLFADLIERFPDLRLNLKTEHRESMGKLLMAGELDVYLGILSKEELDPSLFVKHVTQVEHGIVLREDDPISQTDTINPADLASYKWVSFTVDPVTEQKIEKFTLPKGASKSLINIRTTSLATGLQLVKSGIFVMSAPLLLANVVAKEGLVIRPVLHRMEPRDAGIHVRKSSLEYDAIKTVIKYFDQRVIHN
ncbi:LysR family transcriptional regulator [Ruegeria lacuscaerulensis]|uniref:LysR family transcriptional regulator n=1 Tax=Ruegeria lacuscaerulensis TaxID=55218 RepID=UPI001479F6E9|nr:LysR family transcriptional regulator [Ruegeria lacuscaerulensis]